MKNEQLRVFVLDFPNGDSVLALAKGKKLDYVMADEASFHNNEIYPVETVAEQVAEFFGAPVKRFNVPAKICRRDDWTWSDGIDWLRKKLNGPA